MQQCSLFAIRERPQVSTYLSTYYLFSFRFSLDPVYLFLSDDRSLFNRVADQPTD